MSWFTELINTYETISTIEKDKEIEELPFPIAHLTFEAKLEITISPDGEFIRASRVPKDEATTIVPVTEDSASRSSGITPLPLCDKLCYIAGDYDANITAKRGGKPMREYFETYMRQLKEWADSIYTTDKVKAIYKYLSKETVISDLLRSNVYESESDFVRFIVEESENPEQIFDVWKDKDTIQAWVDYYLSGLNKYDVDYATGEIIPVTNKLPAKVRNTGDKAKLISSNDTSGFTYRGRFITADQAVTVGYLSSQKAFNALRWLIAKQGYQNGSESIVTWAVNVLRVPDFMNGIDSLFETEDIPEVDTAEAYAKRINKAIAGYKTNIDVKDKIITMSVDSTGPGRLAISYYNELSSSQFYNNLQSWYKECSWERNSYDSDGKSRAELFTPVPWMIASAAYGVERNGRLESSNDELKKKCVDRILPCIVQHRKFPRDIMRSAIRNVSDPMRYKSTWKKILEITCALIRKVSIDEGRELTMALNKDSIDRSYLFGRLLAVLDQVESQVNYRNDNKDRETNAKKYWSTYVKKPASSFRIIREKLNPYLSKMSDWEQDFYSRQFEEILEKLEKSECFTNSALDEKYLLGYYSQRHSYRTKNESDKEEE